MPEGKLTAICDINPDKLAAAKAYLPEDVACFDRAETMMDSGLVDAVLVAVPHYDHPPLVILALEKGLHVMSEKPAGVYTKQVRQMNQAAERSDKLLASCFRTAPTRSTPRCTRWSPAARSGRSSAPAG